MDLRTGNEQLRRVNVRIDSLVEDIRTELLARDDVSKGLSDGKIHSLLKYIANPLKNISIDGNEMMLDDMLDLYDLVINELDQIVQTKKYSDEKTLSKSEIETFEKARDVLKTDKENGIDVIDQVYTEVIKEHRSGKLEKTYIGRKISESKEIDEINQKIYALGTDISHSLRPTLDLIDKLSPEFDLFVDAENAFIKLDKIDKKLAELATERSNPDLSEKEIETLEIAEESWISTKIDIIIGSNPEFKKDEYAQEENESLASYAERLHTALSVQSLSNEELLIQKLDKVYKDKINIAEFDADSKTYTLKEVNFKDRYFDKTAEGERPSNEELKEFAKKIRGDLEELQTAVDAKIDEKTELEAQKAELETEIEEEIKSSTLSVVPYVERNDGKELSAFAKWGQRMAFRFKNPEVMFVGKKGVEDAMCKAKIKNATIELDRTRLLQDVERKQNKFKEKYVVKTKVKSNIYKSWDKNRIPNSREDRSR